MFDYVEVRTFGAPPEDVSAGAGAVLTAITKATSAALGPGLWTGRGPAEGPVTPAYTLKAVAAPGGAGTLVELVPDLRLTAVDFSPVAIELASRHYAQEPNVKFRLMDAHKLDLPDSSFDDVVWIEAIEHVRDPRKVLLEAARVLRDDGRILVSSANRDSVNQVLTRKLGHPEFVTNHQHIREFTLVEIRAALAEVGFDVTATAGVSLLPYWGVPGVDELVRRVTDDDPEFVAMMRLLGERAGAEHAYTGVVVATRR